MYRTGKVLICSILGLLASLVMAADVKTLSGLTAEEIIDRNIAARGGLQAWRAVETLSFSGKLEAGGNESPTLRARAVRTGGARLPKRPAEQAQLPFRLQLKRSRKSRLEIDFRSQTAIQVFDGTQGWKLRPFLNRHEVEQFTPDEMKSMSTQSDLDGPLVDFAAKGTRVELDGIEKVDGKETYRLKLTYKGGQVQHLWVDARTFLESKIEGTPRHLDGKYHPVEIYYRDYRNVDGLMIPYVTETKVEGVNQTEKIEVEKVAVNQPVEDARFAKLR